MSYTLRGWTPGVKAKKDYHARCCVCRRPFKKGQLISDQDIYKCGEFQYWELAHTHCIEGD